MRLWDYRILPYLPKSQLLSQWRELNSIFKKQDKHILINYIYNYPKEYLENYTKLVILEMYNRNINIKSYQNADNYFNKKIQPFSCQIKQYKKKMFKEHDNDYLSICFYNLKEKYIRGQKDFTNECWEQLYNFYIKYSKEE